MRQTKPAWAAYSSLAAPVFLWGGAMVALLAAMPAGAQSVAMTGSMGSKALLVVDGSSPKPVAAGETYRGVKVVSVSGSEAVVEVGGKKLTVSMGAGPVGFKGSSGGSGAGTRIVLSSGENGHYLTSGMINGRAAQFVVDTGASVVSLGRADAERMGIRYQNGQQVMMGTANGSAIGWRVSLDSVRVQDVEVYNVEAVVMPESIGIVLLGNSFLNHFQMKREGDTLTLDKRY